MRDYKIKYFTGSNGRLYRKETDYANRSWWYTFEYVEGVGGWALHDGKPEVELTEREDCTNF